MECVLNNYRKLLIIVLAVVLVTGTLLGFKRKKVELINPDEIITLNEASEIAQGYTLKQGEVKKTGNKLSVIYNADPLGSGDNIQIELVYYSDEYPRSSVEELFKSEHQKLMVYEEVSDMGEQAFISFPSIHIYEKGFYLKITGGSGNDTTQASVLKSLGQVAMKNMNKYISSKRLK